MHPVIADADDFPSDSSTDQWVAKLIDRNTTVTLLHIRQHGYLPQTDYDTIYLQRVVPAPHRIAGAYCRPPSLARALNVPEREIKHPVIESEPLTPS